MHARTLCDSHSTCNNTLVALQYYYLFFFLFSTQKNILKNTNLTNTSPSSKNPSLSITPKRYRAHGSKILNALSSDYKTRFRWRERVGGGEGRVESGRGIYCYKSV
jgi:hypothetical protein